MQCCGLETWVSKRDLSDPLEHLNQRGDHVYYENVWRFNTQAKPDAPLLNDLRVSKKTKHFVINPNWDEQRLLEEMTYAYHSKNRIEKSSGDINVLYNGIVYKEKETIFITKFSDGTPVEIIYRSKTVISGVLVPDHISLLSISKPNF